MTWDNLALEVALEFAQESLWPMYAERVWARNKTTKYREWRKVYRSSPEQKEKTRVQKARYRAAHREEIRLRGRQSYTTEQRRERYLREKSKQASVNSANGGQHV